MTRMLAATMLFLGLVLQAWSGLEASSDKVKEATERAARDYLQHGLIQASEGHEAAAEKSFREAIKLKPQWAEAYSLLGSALARAGKYAEAEEALRKAVSLKPDYGEGYYYLGLFLEERGKAAEAQEAFRKAKQYQK